MKVTDADDFVEMGKNSFVNMHKPAITKKNTSVQSFVPTEFSRLTHASAQIHAWT